MTTSTLTKTLKIIGISLVVIIAAAGILLACAVRFVDSRYLAPMVQRMANEYVDGEVKLGGLRLAFAPHFPILGIELDDLTVISHAFDSLSPQQRGLLPQYADSLITLSHMRGAIDIKRMMLYNELSLHDVELRGLSVNLVIAHNGKPNYDVIKISPDTTSSKVEMPGFRIDRFALTEPKEMRFYNAADSTSASVILLSDAALEGDQQPIYRLKINGNVKSPKATLMTNLDEIRFGLNGKVYWNPNDPGLVAVDQMELRGAFMKAVVSGEVDLTEDPIARKLSIDLSPVAISDLMTLLPDSIRRQHRLYSPYFSTDMAIAGHMELTEPMDLTTDTIPSADIKISVPPSTLRYGNARLKDIAADLFIRTYSNRPDLTKVNLKHFTVAGSGTDLKASASLATPVSDPTFEADVEGRIDFRDLPPIALEEVPGYLSGVMTASLKAKGSTSMLTPERFHKLTADGAIEAHDVYYLSADTSRLIQIGNAKIALDSRHVVKGLPLLNAKVDVDTATILISGIDLAFGDISLGAKVEDSPNRADTTLMHSIAADLKAGRFNITSITDSAGARIRELSGPVRIERRKGHKVPLISADLLIGQTSAGTLSDRFIFNSTHLMASLAKEKSMPKSREEAKRKPMPPRDYSYISPAAVHRYVYWKRKHGHHVRRVYTDDGDSADDRLVWDLTPQFCRFLNEWTLQGSLASPDARMISPVFPIRNRFSDVALNFSNDTIDISRISLSAGVSDITMTGLVTNVRRALTATTDNVLRSRISLQSDTVDINQIADAILTGAAYADERRHGKDPIRAHSDSLLASEVGDFARKGPGKRAPVLIPVNVETNLRLDARHLLYSGVDLQSVGADVAVAGGVVRLNDLKATSDAGSVSVTAQYTAPRLRDMRLGFGMDLSDFNIAKFVKMVPAIDSITPLMHDFSGIIAADLSAICRLDSGMNFIYPTLNAKMHIRGTNLAFIDPEKYRTLGKWLGFKDKTDNTIHSLDVDMTVADGILQVEPFMLSIDRYRLGIYGHNNFAMDFDYHIAVLKSFIPFKFGITISGNPHDYKVRFGGPKFNEDSVDRAQNLSSPPAIMSEYKM